jgi:hypothetical protein
MSNQDIITLGRDNPVIVEFANVDLTQFTNIQASFKDDVRTSTANPDSVKVNSATELELNFQDTTETGAGYWTIIGFNALYPDGFILVGTCIGISLKSSVC